VRGLGYFARPAAALAGLTGFYILVRLDLWDRFVMVTYWWMHAMVAIWLLFTLLLFDDHMADHIWLHAVLARVSLAIVGGLDREDGMTRAWRAAG
jgi:hypothetical protein